MHVWRPADHGRGLPARIDRDEGQVVAAVDRGHGRDVHHQNTGRWAVVAGDAFDGQAQGGQKIGGLVNRGEVWDPLGKPFVRDVHSEPRN